MTNFNAKYNMKVFTFFFQKLLNINVKYFKGLYVNPNNNIWWSNWLIKFKDAIVTAHADKM